MAHIPKGRRVKGPYKPMDGQPSIFQLITDDVCPNPYRYFPSAASLDSLAVNAAQSISTSGTLTPLRALSLPPRTTFTCQGVTNQVACDVFGG